jgi:hypothetical protein
VEEMPRITTRICGVCPDAPKAERNILGVVKKIGLELGAGGLRSLPGDTAQPAERVGGDGDASRAGRVRAAVRDADGRHHYKTDEKGFGLDGTVRETVRRFC